MTGRGPVPPPSGVRRGAPHEAPVAEVARAPGLPVAPDRAGDVPSRGWVVAGGRTATVGTGSARRAAIGSSPGTERGRKMRAQLLVAARGVFERDGYLNARVADIAAAAGASHGSFYTYFESKTEIFRAVVTEQMETLYKDLGSPPPSTAGPAREHSGPSRSVASIVDGIEGANRRFVEMYQSNTALLALFEQVTTFDDEVRALRLKVRGWMVDRVAASIRRMQEDGQVETSLDPHYAASALVAMVNGLVQHWLVVGEPFEAEPLVRTLTQLWATSLGLPVPPDRWSTPLA